MERSTLLNKPQSPKKSYMLLSVTDSLMFPNLKEIIDKHWHLININADYRETFKK